MAMLVFGLTGMVIAGVVALTLLLGAFAARDIDVQLEADQARIAGSLTRLSVTMESLALTTTNAQTTLATSSDTVAEAQGVLRSTADTLVALSQSLDVDILGSRPFGSAAQRLADLALTVNGFEAKAQTLALNLHQNSADAGVIADQIRQLKDDVQQLTTRITSFDRIGDLVTLLLGGIVLAALLTAWAAIGAAFCAWAGWRLRRRVAGEQLILPDGIED